MKCSNLSNLIGASAIGLSLAVLPLSLPVSAQTETAPGTTTAPDTTTTAPIDGTNNVEQGDRDFDWGWLGLIGLAGLAGLSGKKETVTAYRDPDVVSTTPGYRE
ncbi:WGxxGxxG family protein [Synechocystis sp. PCC 7509]|uniref:WGxxGxxG family protein n=1 Tax=Synechocystis sp. PCC 7509 TaxID=927677 RepID=UPI0002ACE1AB|nr:WGxxGxxG family protein [Synechocystis sp. PCC 7509]